MSANAKYQVLSYLAIAPEILTRTTTDGILEESTLNGARSALDVAELSEQAGALIEWPINEDVYYLSTINYINLLRFRSLAAKIRGLKLAFLCRDPW